MIDKLENLVREMESENTSSKRTIDPETEAMLQSLGYVSASRSKPAPGPSSVDPKNRMAVWNQIQFGIFQFGGGD